MTTSDVRKIDDPATVDPEPQGDGIVVIVKGPAQETWFSIGKWKAISRQY